MQRLSLPVVPAATKPLQQQQAAVQAQPRTTQLLFRTCGQKTGDCVSSCDMHGGQGRGQLVAMHRPC